MMFLILILCLLAQPCLAYSQSLCFTFDDGLNPRKEPQAALLNAELLAGLARHHVQSMLFPAGKNIDTEVGFSLVYDWARAGHAIGNHSFSHRSLGSSQMSLEEFSEDVLRADRMLHDLPHFVPRFRFPYLNEGDTAEKRDGFRIWMREHHYRPAPVSIDTSDWYYSLRYQQLLNSGHNDLVPVLRQAYLDHLKNRALYYDGLAKALLSRTPAHVLLLHTNAINAAYIGDVIEMFGAMGWSIVSPEEAFSDTLYSKQPAILPAGESILWGLAKEAQLPDLRYPGEDGEYEKPIVDALGLPDPSPSRQWKLNIERIQRSPLVLLILPVVLAVVFLVLSGWHIYMAFRNLSGDSGAVPTFNGQPVFVPTRLGTMAVALVLLLSAILVAATGRIISLGLSPRVLAGFSYALAIGLFGRAIGEFKYVGFFKRVRGTRFATLDSFVFSPLCLVLALGLAIVALNSGR
ncbi:MAG: DUF3995 domain-containing protein [Terriglobia bacterium]